MQALCLIWGILAALGMLVAFFPCLGALNWLNVPFSVVGLIVSAVIYGNSPPNSRNEVRLGLILCAVAAALGFIRLKLGGGVL